MEQELGTDREAATADMRYQYIEGICARYLKKGGHSRERARTEKIDAVLTHKVWALPVFFLLALAGAACGLLLYAAGSALQILCDIRRAVLGRDGTARAR